MLRDLGIPSAARQEPVGGEAYWALCLGADPGLCSQHRSSWAHHRRSSKVTTANLSASALPSSWVNKALLENVRLEPLETPPGVSPQVLSPLPSKPLGQPQLFSIYAVPEGRAGAVPQMSWSHPPAPRTQCGPRGKTWPLRVLSEALRVRLLTVAPGAPAGPTRPDSTRGSHSVQQMPLFIFMCFQKSERSETQLRYKIQHKMRFIPIFPQKAKNFSEIVLPKLIGRSYFPPLVTMASAPGPSTSPLGAWEVGMTLALRMTGDNHTPWPPGLTN